MHIDEAKGRLKTRFQTAFILKVFRRRLRLSESWKQWFEQQKTRACVPHTPYTLVLKFVPPAGKVCGVATHAVGRDAGYGLLRKIYPEGAFYTWFDYRGAMFQRKLGLRIDHILTSPELAATLTDVTVDLETRAQERPSDHAPVIAEFDC